MLIRSQDGRVYNLAYIASFEVRPPTPEVEAEAGGGYAVLALLPDLYQQPAVSPASHVILARTNDEAEAHAILDRIMWHRDGNLDLTQREPLRERTSEPAIAPPGFNQ